MVILPPEFHREFKHLVLTAVGLSSLILFWIPKADNTVNVGDR